MTLTVKTFTDDYELETVPKRSNTGRYVPVCMHKGSINIFTYILYTLKL